MKDFENVKPESRVGTWFLFLDNIVLLEQVI